MKTVLLLGTGLVLLATRTLAGGEAPLELAPPKARGMTNPFAGQERARRAGEKLFRRECAECHGVDAAGGGKAPPLKVPVVTNAPPGAIFWVLRNGSLYRGMPSFAHIPEPQRWQIVTYLRSLAAAR
ncbi:MAG TPA: c-type cytochrome [Bryobacteraceae bacterium]|nr:c-type cytochrome [Bryobacteraceae bacterium]